MRGVRYDAYWEDRSLGQKMAVLVCGGRDGRREGARHLARRTFEPERSGVRRVFLLLTLGCR